MEPADLERFQEEVHAAGLDLGEVEDVVDQPQLMLAGRVDPLEVRDQRLLVEVRGLLLEHLGVADDGVRGRAQLVGHVRQELRLVLAGFAKLAIRLLEISEEPGVLDANHGLVGERLQERNLAVGKRLDVHPPQDDCADRSPDRLSSALSIWGGTWSQRAVGGYLEDEFATGLSSRRRMLPT